MPNLSQVDLNEIHTKLQKEINEKPPTIGIVGVSGVGKSSTINAMFKTQLKVSHTVAGTKEFGAIDLALQFTHEAIQNTLISLRVVDAPGLGESRSADVQYIQMYREHLPACDVILWVLSARNRAMALDQMYLEELANFRERIVFGVNQVDLVYPMNWENHINMPSVGMVENIKKIVEDRAQKLEEVIKRPPTILAYSAERGYQLTQLFEMVLNSLPSNRRWLFDGLKNFSYKDFIPAELIVELEGSPAEQQGRSTISSWVKGLGLGRK